MDVIDAIYQRKSIRGFKKDPVKRQIIRDIIGAATRAPSGMNTQPWEFFVISGDVLNQIQAVLKKKFNDNVPMDPDRKIVKWPQDSIYRQRQVEIAKQLYSLMGINREDKLQRKQWMELGVRFFDAPVAIILLTDRILSESGPLIEIGAALQNICLAALPYGLGTCIEGQGVIYPEVLRKYAGIPENKRIIIGVAIGYPDPDFPANQVMSDREPLDGVITWAEGK